MRKLVLAAVLAISLPATLFAQLPPGKWWHRPEIVKTLGLTDDQQGRLDKIFRASANDLIDMKGEVEKLSIALRGSLDQPQLDRTAIQRVAARLSEARSRLFERELMLLVDMRAVLTDAQWNRMRQELERFGPGRPGGPPGDRRDGHRPFRP